MSVVGAVVTVVHRALYRWLGGRGVDSFGGRKMLLLTTTGRKSGKQRTIPIQYGMDGDRMVIVGSNWGGTRHAAWYWNLMAQPRAVAQVGRRWMTVTAHVTAGEERERLWAMMARMYPGYETYARRTEGAREIPVVVLTVEDGTGNLSR